MTDSWPPPSPEGETPYVISPSADVLAAEAPSRHVGRWIAAGGSAVAVAVLATGGFVAYGALSGGGTQADTFVPANAVAYVELDLNPPASQKINAVRLLHKLPKSDLDSTSDDYRDLLLSAVFSKDDTVNYDKDIKPWLGDRAAVAVLPSSAGGTTPDVEGVFQVSDEAAFKAAAPTLFKDSGGYVLRDGFVIVSDDTDIATRISDSASNADLASDSDYVLDTKNLGDRIVTGWYDESRLGGLLPSQVSTLSPALSGQLKGRATFAVHVEPNAVELVANATGTAATASGNARLLGTLPSNTVAAVEVTGFGANIGAQWSQLLKSLSAEGISPDQFLGTYEKQFGLKLPADLETLLGSDTVAAVTADSGKPSYGYLAVTDPAKAKDLVDRLTPLVSQFGIPKPIVTANGIAIGTSPTWAKDATSGNLGDSAEFKDALPDYATAQFAAYVDVAGAEKLDQVGGSGVRAVQNAGVEAVGITSTTDGTTSHLRVRVTIK
jgi:Protein of unknown function (DUF3352)